MREKKKKKKKEKKKEKTKTKIKQQQQQQKQTLYSDLLWAYKNVACIVLHSQQRDLISEPPVPNKVHEKPIYKCVYGGHEESWQPCSHNRNP